MHRAWHRGSPGAQEYRSGQARRDAAVSSVAPPRRRRPGYPWAPWPLTFLHGLKRVVGLDDLDGVGDLLALQDIIVEAQVGYGQLEYPVVLGRVLLEDGTWRRGGVKTRTREELSLPSSPHPYPCLGHGVIRTAGCQVVGVLDWPFSSLRLSLVDQHRNMPPTCAQSFHELHMHIAHAATRLHTCLTTTAPPHDPTMPNMMH